MDLAGSYVFPMQAVKAALHMLENGASIEEAKSVCAPSDLSQLAKWKVQTNYAFFKTKIMGYYCSVTNVQQLMASIY